MRKVGKWRHLSEDELQVLRAAVEIGKEDGGSAIAEEGHSTDEEDEEGYLDEEEPGKGWEEEWRQESRTGSSPPPSLDGSKEQDIK